MVGLIGGHQGGRPLLLSAALRATVVDVASKEALTLKGIEALTLKGIAHRVEALHQCVFPCSRDTLGAALKAQGFSFKRTRWSLKKRNPDKFAARTAKLAELKRQARRGECPLISYDEAGLAASRPVQRSGSPLGKPPLTTPEHPQRVSVKGALNFAHPQLIHQQAVGTVKRPTLVAFIDPMLLHVAPSQPTFIVLDNAKIHHGLDDEITPRWLTGTSVNHVKPQAEPSYFSRQ